MKKVLITGASGMLGATLSHLWKKKYHIFATGNSDFSENTAALYKVFDLKNKDYKALCDWAQPDVIVHCAAITNNEYCEKHIDQAFEVNSRSVEKFVKFAPHARLIYISTDAVFPRGSHMVNETTRTAPISSYGKSKEAGEQYALSSSSTNTIIRTTIVGKNINAQRKGFVEWIISSVQNGVSVPLFDDVIFTPISIWHFARELEWIVDNHPPRILHIVGGEIISKYEFGYKLCKELNLNTSLIKKESIMNTPFASSRSLDQTLDSSYYTLLSGRKLPTVKETVKIIIKNFK